MTLTTGTVDRSSGKIWLSAEATGRGSFTANALLPCTAVRGLPCGGSGHPNTATAQSSTVGPLQHEPVLGVGQGVRRTAGQRGGAPLHPGQPAPGAAEGVSARP